jgi:hypothetical protein
VQKFITKYGLAAHLALAAMAPLCLSRFFGDETVAYTMLWISASALGWMFMAPSIFRNEHLKDARKRVLRSVFTDFLTWVMVLITVVAGVRALNGGIRMVYDAEEMVWSISSATFPLLPGIVDGCGLLPFAATVLATVLVVACRHALGKAGRLAFCFMSSSLAGALGVAELLLGHWQGVNVSGIAYGVYLLMGTVALSGAFEFQWNRSMLFFVLAIGGNAAGLLGFAEPLHIVSFLAGELILLGYVFYYTHAILRRAAEFKLLVVFGLSLAVGLFIALSLIPEQLVSAKLDAIISWKLFPENFFELRSVLSEIALRSWKVHPWLGSGMGSFPLDVKFFATEADWLVLVSERSAAMNGYWHLLAERGIVGVAFLGLPLVFLIGYYFIALVRGVMAFRLPHPAAFSGVLVFAAVLVDAFFGVNFLRCEVLAAIAFALAVSTKSFPKEKIDGR